MKDFIKKCLITFSLIMLGSALVSGIFNRDLSGFQHLMQIFLATAVIYFGQLLTNRFSSIYRILELLLEFAMVLVVVLTSGWIFKWYTLQSIWIFGTLVALVYVGCYVLDITRTRKDVEFINQQIQIRKKRMESNVRSEDNI